jgi:O-antigen/teichoic acid export membrane protein
MVRRFFRDSAIYVLPYALSSGISFFLFPFYAHYFTPRQYGVFDLLMLGSMLVGWTVALEIYQGVGRYVAGEKDPVKARSYASSALWFALGAYVAFAAVAEAFAPQISHVVLGAHVEVNLLRVGVLLACVNGVLAIAQAQLRWQLRPGAFAVAALINGVITITASALLVFAAHLGVEGAILGQVIGSAVALGYVMIATYGTFRWEFDLARCKQMLAYSIPLVPSSVGVFLNLYADRLVIQHERSLYDLGLYGVGYRLAMIVSLLLSGFQAAATPLILSRAKEESTPRDVARIFRIFTAATLSMFVALSLLATPLLRILAAPEYQRAASVVPFLVISTAFANMYMFAPGLVIAKKTTIVAALTVVAGVANLVLALALVGPLGIDGAGIATAVTSLGWFVAIMAASQRYYPVPHRWGQLVGALTAALSLVAISLLILPSDRGSALDAGILAVRCLLILAGTAVSIRLALGPDELRATWAAVARRVAVRRRVTTTA